MALTFLLCVCKSLICPAEYSYLRFKCMHADSFALSTAPYIIFVYIIFVKICDELASKPLVQSHLHHVTQILINGYH